MSKVEELSKQYREFREQCGIKDPVMLNEIEEAYYAGYQQAEKDLHKPIYKAGFLDGFEDAVEGQYEKGYEQAKKDLELTVDDIMKIDVLLIEMWNQPENKYQEILKRFKERKENDIRRH